MAFINENDNVSVLKDNIYSDEILVKENSFQSGKFFVGNVFTPKHFVGKKISLKILVVGDIKNEKSF